MNSSVVVEKMAETKDSLKMQFIRSFHHLALKEDFAWANAVFIKPNLTFPSYREGVTTRLSFVECLVAALRSINSTTKIYIGEGEGGYQSFSMSNGMREMGFYGIAEKYANVQIVNLTDLPRRRVTVRAKGKFYAIDLPDLFFREIDFSITCPLPKIHCMTKITLSFKNQWGCIPDVMRLKNHYVFDEIISQICSALKFRYAFLDGKYGLDKNGPIIGEPVEVGWFVASNSLGAHDMVVSDMMGIDWRRVKHLKRAAEFGNMPNARDIEIIGNPALLKRKFVLKRSFWNYPALAAFHSKQLTQLFYFSPWANLLHDIMYTFRGRSIE